MNRFRLMPSYHYYNDSTGVIETRYKKPLRDYQIYGNPIQEGTPSPDNPIEIQSVGEKTVNLFDIEKFVTLEGNSNYYKIENGNLVQVANDYRSNDSLPTAITLEPGIYCFTPLGYQGNWSSYRLVNKNNASGIYENPFTITETTEIAVKWWTGKGVVLGNPMCNVGEKTLPFEPFGKYKIPIEVSNENAGTQTYNIFLDEPLGEMTDYIDYKNQSVVTSQGLTKIEVPKIQLNKGTNIIKVKTTVEPSNVNWQYYK